MSERPPVLPEQRARLMSADFYRKHVLMMVDMAIDACSEGNRMPAEMLGEPAATVRFSCGTASRAKQLLYAARALLENAPLFDVGADGTGKRPALRLVAGPAKGGDHA